MEPYRLTATKVAAKFKDGTLTVEQYARSLLSRIRERDSVVKAWAYLDEDYVIEQAKKLDQVPVEARGPLYGVAIGVKDVIYTKDMPTQFNSSIYENDAPKVDAASIIVLRKAGALILGKTTTTEFAATTQGPKTTNPHNPGRTPGGSSSGSGAAVGDFQVPIGLGTQTGGSTIRPGSFNGIYALKPTWNAISREGQKNTRPSWTLWDDEPAKDDFTIKGAKFAICKTVIWPQVGDGTAAAMVKAKELLEAQGAEVEEIELPESVRDLPKWHATIMSTDGRTAFFPDYCYAKDEISDYLAGHVENRLQISRATELEAFDNISAARPVVDKVLKKYAAVIVPSVPDEAPEGLATTGSANFNVIWTALHTPVINVPGFAGKNGLPIGLSLVAPRYHDRHLLAVSQKVGEVFESQGGFTSKLVNGSL